MSLEWRVFSLGAVTSALTMLIRVTDALPVLDVITPFTAVTCVHKMLSNVVKLFYSSISRQQSHLAV